MYYAQMDLRWARHPAHLPSNSKSAPFLVTFFGSSVIKQALTALLLQWVVILWDQLLPLTLWVLPQQQYILSSSHQWLFRAAMAQGSKLLPKWALLHLSDLSGCVISCAIWNACNGLAIELWELGCGETYNLGSSVGYAYWFDLWQRTFWRKQVVQ